MMLNTVLDEPQERGWLSADAHMIYHVLKMSLTYKSWYELGLLLRNTIHSSEVGGSS
jgi:hypothetical protein